MQRSSPPPAAAPGVAVGVPVPAPRTTAFKKPAARPKYGEMMSAWMRRAELRGQADDPDAIPDELADQYTIKEREERYEELCDENAARYGMRAGDDSDVEEEDHSKELNDMLPDRRREMIDELFSRRSAARAASSHSGPGYEVFDLKALDADPDERLIGIDGTQECLDPLEDDPSDPSYIPDEQFDQLRTEESRDTAVFLRSLDPQVRLEDWTTPALEQKIASMRIARSTRSLEEWKLEFKGHVRRFIGEGRRTKKRVELVFFVRQHLFMLFLVDRVSDESDQTLPAAHFYAWSWQRAHELLDARKRSLAK